MANTTTSGCTLACQCGHRADFDEFTRRPITGDLPPGQYQCPSCGGAWRVDHREAESQPVPGGGFYTPPSRLVPISPVL